MIYVLTVHHRDDRFVDLQLDALERHMSVPYRVHAVLDGVESGRFDRVVDVDSTKHGPRLDALAADAVDVAGPHDVLLFLDGDAWPIADPTTVLAKLGDVDMMVAVRRDEGSGAGWPHPSFAAITAGDWVQLAATWQPQTWPDRRVKHRRDVGVDYLLKLDWWGAPWTPLLRSNTANPHHLFFAVYGDVVYHHGAGFRPPISSREGRDRARLEANRRLSDEWYAAAVADPEFWRVLCEP